MAPRDFNKGRRPYSFLLLVTTPSLGSSCSDAFAVESCTPATSFISAYVAGVKMDCEQVNLADHKTASGIDFYTINPKGNVPSIVDGDLILNENSATLQFM